MSTALNTKSTFEANRDKIVIKKVRVNKGTVFIKVNNGDGEIGQIKEDITNIQESQQESLQELQNEISELKKNNDNKFAELLERIEVEILQ